MASDEKLFDDKLERFLAETSFPNSAQYGLASPVPADMPETRTSQPELPETRVAAPVPELPDTAPETRVAAPFPELPDTAPETTGWEDIPVTDPNERGWWDDRDLPMMARDASHPSTELEPGEAAAQPETRVAGGDDGSGSGGIVDILTQILRLIQDGIRDLVMGGVGSAGGQSPGSSGSPSVQNISPTDFGMVRDPRQNEYFPAASPSVQSSSMAGLKGAGGYGFGSVPNVPGYAGDVGSLPETRVAAPASPANLSPGTTKRFGQPEGGPS